MDWYLLYKQKIRKSQYKRFYSGNYSVILHHLYHNALLRSCQRCSCQLRPVSSTSSQGPIPRWLLRKMVHIVYCSCTSVWFRNDWDIHIFCKFHIIRNPASLIVYPIKVNPLNLELFKTFTGSNVFPINLWSRSVQGFLSYNRTSKVQTDKQRLLL